MPISGPSLQPVFCLLPKISCISCCPSGTLGCSLAHWATLSVVYWEFPFSIIFPTSNCWDQIVFKKPSPPPQQQKTHSNIHQNIGNSHRNWPFLVSYPQSIAFIYDTGLTRTPSQNSLNSTFTSLWRGSCSFLHRYLPYITLSVNKNNNKQDIGTEITFPNSVPVVSQGIRWGLNERTLNWAFCGVSKHSPTALCFWRLAIFWSPAEDPEQSAPFSCICANSPFRMSFK